MRLLNQITDSAKQQYTLSTDEGEVFDLLLKFNPVRDCWVYDLTFEEKQINNRQLTISPNCLYQYKNIFPFGLACISIDGGEPQALQDFKSGRVQLFVLNASEVQDVQQNIYEVQ